MENHADKSASDSEINQIGIDKTPTGIIFTQYKRRREDDFVIEFNNFKTEIKSMMQTQEREMKKIFNDKQQSNKADLLENQIREDRKYIILLEEKIEDLQMSPRKANFEIKNVPKTKENLIEMVAKQAGAVGSNLA
ncbi:unnamed protein product [Diatraea saccharalis]|uniref:Uncharacterized protein n=1 Tax=Diatraea saccharalis TaxID=40085 RepID=A0A9N9REA0_9NEOP|nr:unnamed protein product [Diatraea saccharalis]